MTVRRSNPSPVPVWAPLLLAALAWGAGTVRAAEPVVAFEERPDGLQVRVGGTPFARYVYSVDALSRPYFTDVCAPDGTRVTRNHPPIEGKDLTDHPAFHPGLWVAFGDLNGADSWRNRDRIRHAGFVEGPKGGAGRGTFAVRNLHEKSGRVIGEEVCRITVFARPAGHLIVWDSEFRPVGEPLVFGDQEEMGLAVRVATPLTVVKGGRITDSEGRTNEAGVWGKQADWSAYSGEVEGKPVGVALVPGPGNFRRSWFHARDTGLLEANPFGRNAFTKGEVSRVVVKPGESLRLRFGVLTWNGRADPASAYRDCLTLLK